MTDDPLDEMKAFVGFGPEDEALLTAFWPVVAPRVREIVDQFYEPILRTPAAMAVMEDEAQVERLKVSLGRWLEQLLRGPWDAAYFEGRTRIGRVHVDVKLPSRFMFTAMDVMRRKLFDIAWETQPAGKVQSLCGAIDRITSIDLAIMTGTYIDSRARQDMESLQDVLISHMPVTVLLLDERGHVTAATRPGTRLFGSRSIIGGAYTEALPPALVDAAGLRDAMRRALDTRRDIVLNRVDVVLDDKLRSFRIAIVPLEHALACVLLHVEELTEAVEAEARLVRTEALAQLGALSAAVAHELRNPLAGISGAIQVIARSLPEGDRRREIMDKVEGQVYRLNAMVTDLLSFARQDPVRMGDLALGEVVRPVIEAAETEHPRARIRVEGDGPAWADAEVLRPIVGHLLNNALQAVDGQGEVLVRLAPGSVLVADSGPGVPPQDRDRIFKPFFTTRTRGTGLGLAIAEKGIREMGGAIELLKDGPLGGAAFRLTLQERAPNGG